MFRLVRSSLFNFLFGSLFGVAMGGAAVALYVAGPVNTRIQQIVANDREIRANYERAITGCEGALAVEREKVLRASRQQ